MKYKLLTAFTCILLFAGAAGAVVNLQNMDFSRVHPMVRIKDVVDVEGARSNQLTGIGLVMGLAGTGDRSQMTTQMMRNLLQQHGITVDERAARSRNVAVVSLTADLPPYVRPGQTINLNVSTIGDARSLQGGVLLQTPLRAADGQVYAVAQGPVVVGGFEAAGAGATAVRNIPTAGRIPGGAIVEREVPAAIAVGGQMALLLRNPNFTTAQRITDAINSVFGAVARPTDAGRVVVNLPQQFATSPTAFMARLETLEIQPDMVARVAINERTGTVVMGGDVRISSVAVAHGNLTVSIAEDPTVVQPAPFGGGRTAVEQRTDITIEEDGMSFIAMPATTTVRELVRVINAIGASPRDVIAILEAIHEAGALHGQLINM